MENSTGLFYASCKAYTQIIKILIMNGAFINMAKLDGTTPLMGAAYFGHISAVRLLLRHGATPNAKDLNGFDAYFYAASGPRSESKAVANIMSILVATNDSPLQYLADQAKLGKPFCYPHPQRHPFIDLAQFFHRRNNG